MHNLQGPDLISGKLAWSLEIVEANLFFRLLDLLDIDIPSGKGIQKSIDLGLRHHLSHLPHLGFATYVTTTFTYVTTTSYLRYNDADKQHVGDAIAGGLQDLVDL